jgi:hypothetical protein
MAAHLTFGALDGLVQRQRHRLALALCRKSLLPGLDGYLDNLQTLLLLLRAKRNAGARALAQNAGNPFHPLLGLRMQRLGDPYLSGGELHFHGQPPLLSFFSQPRFPAGDYGFYSICLHCVRRIGSRAAFHLANQCHDAPTNKNPPGSGTLWLSLE